MTTSIYNVNNKCNIFKVIMECFDMCIHITPVIAQGPIETGSKYKNINVYLSSFQKILNV